MTGNPIRQQMRQFNRYSTVLERYTDYRLYSIGHLGEIYLRSVSADDNKRLPIYDPLLLELQVNVQPDAVEHKINLSVYQENILTSSFSVQKGWDVFTLRDELIEMLDQNIEDQEDDDEASSEIDKDKVLEIKESFTLRVKHDYIEVEHGDLQYVVFEVDNPKNSVLICRSPADMLFSELAFVTDRKNYDSTSPKAVTRKILLFVNQLVWERIEVVVAALLEYGKSGGDRSRVDEEFTSRSREELCTIYEKAVLPRLEEVDCDSSAFHILQQLHRHRAASLTDLAAEFRDQETLEDSSRLFTSLSFFESLQQSIKWKTAERGTPQIWSWLPGLQQLLREELLSQVISKHSPLYRAIIKNATVDNVISWHVLDKKQSLFCSVHPDKVVWTGASPGECLVPDHLRVDETRCSGAEGTVLTLIEKNDTDHMLHYWVDFEEVRKTGKLSSLVLIKDYTEFLVSFYAGNYQRQLAVLSQVDSHYTVQTFDIDHDADGKARVRLTSHTDLGEAMDIESVTSEAVKKEVRQMEEESSSELNYYTLPTDFVAHPTAHGVCCHFLDYVTSDAVVSHYLSLCSVQERKLRLLWRQKFDYSCQSVGVSPKAALTISQWPRRGLHFFHLMTVDLNYRLYAVSKYRAQLLVDWHRHSRLKRALGLHGADTFSNSEADLRGRHLFITFSNNLNTDDHPQPIVSFRLQI